MNKDLHGYLYDSNEEVERTVRKWMKKKRGVLSRQLSETCPSLEEACGEWR
jgi:hypothetical protein